MIWLPCAFASATFAGLTSIFAKIGLTDTDSYLATALRTCVVLVFCWLMVALTGSFQGVDGHSLFFLVCSGLTTGASWLCYYRGLQLGDVNKVVAVDKTSTVLTMLLAFLLLGEPLSWLKAFCMVLLLIGTLLMLERKPSRNSGQGNWFWYAVGAAFFAALTAILGKVGIQDVPSHLGTAIRTCVVLVMAWLLVLLQGKQRDIHIISRRSWLFLLLSGLATGASWLFYYYALQQGPASIVVPIDKLSILVTVAFAHWWLKERLSPQAAWGLGLVVGGTLLLLF